MGASLAPYLQRVKTWLLALAAHGMNDESFALTINRYYKAGGSISFFLGAGAMTLIGWLLGSAIGGGAGNFLGDPMVLGLDFAFTGAFIGLLMPQIKGWLNWTVAGVAAVLAIGASQLIPGKWYIIIAALGAAGFGVMMENVEGRNSVNHSRNGSGNLSD
ncbi:MAG: AzlC family ABC transporter permease [Clostridia bacterium]|nr:AzlC family ABC transporter permease [Clostridia bacterium]